MLRAVIVSGTGRAANLGRAAAGKTGTSQDFRDAWFIGYTGQMITGVWMGNDDNSPMDRVTGGGYPAKLWAKYTQAALQGLPIKPLSTSSGAMPAKGQGVSSSFFDWLRRNANKPSDYPEERIETD